MELEYEARFLSVKHHKFRGNLSRIIGLSPQGIMTMETGHLTVTNKWLWTQEVIDINPVSIDNTEDFELHLKKGRGEQVMNFSTDGLQALLCTARRWMMMAREKDRGKLFSGFKIGRSGDRKPIELSANAGDIVEYIDDREVAHYPYYLISAIDYLEEDGGLTVTIYNRKRVYILPDRESFFKEANNKAKLCGIVINRKKKGGNLESVLKGREFINNDYVVARFDVYKNTPRHMAPVKRVMQITENALMELDPESFVITSMIPLCEITHLIRCFNEAQMFMIEFVDRPTRRYSCSNRDALLGALLDICRMQGLTEAMLQVVETHPGIKIHTTEEENANNMELTCLHSLQDAAGVPTTVDGEPVPYTYEMYNAVCEFNCNVKGTGEIFKIKEKVLCVSYLALYDQIRACLQDKKVPEKVPASMFETLYRLILRTELPYYFMQTEGVMDMITAALKSGKEGVVFWAMECLRAVINPYSDQRNEELEKANKQALLVPEFCELLLKLLDVYAFKPTGTIVVMSLMEFLENILSSFSDTTPANVKQDLLKQLSERHSILLSLFHSSCSGVTTSTALIMKTIVEESQSEVAQLMQEAALSEGVLLQHFYNAVYSTSEDQRYISRYLVGLWMGEHQASRALLSRMVPIGIQRFLNHPALTDKEIEAYQKRENARMEENSDLRPSRATSRLRSRIQESKRSTSDRGNFQKMFFEMLNDHSTYTVIWNHETRNELKTALEKELNNLKREQDKVKEGEPKPLWNHEEFFIDYKSLENEIVIDGFYISHMVEDDGKLRLNIDNPGDLFLAIYTRMLREENFDNKVLCIRAMTNLYKFYTNKIGAFYETRQLLDMIDTTANRPYRDHLIILFQALMKHRDNIDMILRDLDNAAEIIMDLLSMAHTASATELRVSSILQNSIIQSGLLLTSGPAKSKGGKSKKSPKPEKEETPKKEPEVIVPPEEPVFVESPDPDFDDNVPLGIPGMGGVPAGMEAMPMGMEGIPSMPIDLNEPAESAEPAEQPTQPVEPVQPAEPDQPAQAEEKEEGIAMWWYITGHEKLEKGPVTVSRLHLLLERNLITPDTEVRSEQGGYAPIKSIRQLRWQLLMEGNSYLEPVACALTVLDIISSILNRHSSFAAEGILKTPIPRAKRVFGQRKYLAYIAQLMLVNNPTLVENAADTIRIITENNEDAMSKLYLTGIFFFAMAYSGSNFLKISSMLYSTHLLQHFNTSPETLTAELPISKRSILGTILPESMICLLDNYGPEEFTKKLLGNFDTPEVIWKYEMRKHMVEEVLKHIGDFPKKLRENPMLLFDYGPIPQVKYSELEEEMWCHNYYIAALCDEKRFNNWPIKKPVELLRAVLDRWRIENTKQAPGVSEEEAYAILGFGPDVERPDENTLKKEYRKLARKYHPDKNPEGRETFEKIQKAFELLSNTRTRSGGPDPVNIMLILKAQRIIYKRFPEKLAEYKYAGYEFLLPILTLAEDEMLTVERCPMLEVASELLYYTCSCTPYNCKEFILHKGIEIVAALINRCLIVPETNSDDPRIPVGEHLMHVISYAAGLEEGRAIMEQISYLPTDIARYPLMIQSSYLVQYGLEAIANASLSAVLQDMMLKSTSCVLWSTLPLLFRFDPSLEENTAVEMDETAHSQQAANNNCKRAALALCRLGGYSKEEPKAPRNKEIRRLLGILLTPSVAAKLSDTDNFLDLLTILNTHMEVPRLIWTSEMRDQLLDFVRARIHDQSETGNPNLEMVNDFVFEAIKDELIVGDVYVRVYNQQHPKNFERADEFCADLLDYLHEQRAGEPDEFGHYNGKYEPKCKKSFIQMVLTALSLVLTNTKDLALTVTNPTAIDDLFSFLQPDEDNDYEETDRLRDSAIKVLKILTPLAPCSKTMLREEEIPWILKMLYADCFPCRVPSLELLVSLAETSEVVAEMRRLNVVLLGIYCLCREEDQVGSEYRTKAVLLLNRMCNDEKEGPKVMLDLRRFIPSVLVNKIKDQYEIVCSQFDSEHETPEIIWTGHMRGQLRNTVEDMTHEWNQRLWNDEDYELPRGFHMEYPELAQELFVGGIYIRLYLKDPKFQLRNPKDSLEGCLKMFFVEAKYEQDRLEGKEVKRNDDEEKYVDATQPDNLKENVLSTITSGIACLLKSTPSLCEHVAMLDYPKKLVSTLKVAVKRAPQSDLTMSVIRIMHDIGQDKACAKKLCQKDTIKSFQALLEEPGQNADYIMETWRIMWKANKKGFSQLGMDMNLIKFFFKLLDHPMQNVNDVNLTKVNIISILKIMEKSNPDAEAKLEEIPAWERYKHQKHDLFVSRNETVDHFIEQSNKILALENNDN